jgi:hypothetical protein
MLEELQRRNLSRLPRASTSVPSRSLHAVFTSRPTNSPSNTSGSNQAHLFTDRKLCSVAVAQQLIIPVVTEEVIVQKRFVLKQEIHVRRGRIAESIPQSVTLDREHVVIERLDAAGNLIERSEIGGGAPDEL